MVLRVNESRKMIPIIVGTVVGGVIGFLYYPSSAAGRRLHHYR
jgi:uncharacterized membrane protein (UPF0136 family)